MKTSRDNLDGKGRFSLKKGTVEFGFLGLAILLAIFSVVYEKWTHNTSASHLTESRSDKKQGSSTNHSNDPLKTDAQIASPLTESLEKKISHTISKGETMQTIFQSLGMDRVHAAHAIKELQQVFNPKALKIGQTLEIQYKSGINGQSAQLISVDFKTSNGHDISLKYENETFTAKKFEIKLTPVLKRVEGQINSSFYAAALKKGVPATVVKEAIIALSHDVNWQHDPKNNDPFVIAYEAFEDEDGNVIRSGELKYAGFAPGGTDWRRIYAFTTSTGRNYYNSRGESIEKGFLQTPVDPTRMRITSKFGIRKDPMRGYSAMHKGVDYSVPHGSSVFAAAEGVVVKAGWNGAYGNYILIKHSGQYETAYAHLSKIHVKVGQRVKQRHHIGNVGATGKATGPHLHHELIYRGKQINPQSVKHMRSTPLQGKEMRNFTKLKNEFDRSPSEPIDISQKTAIGSLDVQSASLISRDKGPQLFPLSNTLIDTPSMVKLSIKESMPILG